MEYQVIYHGLPCSLFYDSSGFFGSPSWCLTSHMEAVNLKLLKQNAFEFFDRGILYKKIWEEEARELIFSTLSQRDESLISLLKPPLLDILMKELELGNSIAEVFSDQRLYVILQQPFKSPIKTDLDNIHYHEVNDPHYWKAEYYDQKNWHILACRF